MKKLLFTFFVVFHVFSVGYLHAENQYTLIDLGTMGYTESRANAINNHGVVVGATEEFGPGFKWEPISLPYIDSRLPFGKITLLELSPIFSGHISVTSINDLNEMVGATYEMHAASIRWDKNGDIASRYHGSSGVDINNSSQFIVWEVGGISLLCQDEICEDIFSSITDSYFSIPKAMNDYGQIVGSFVFCGPIGADGPWVFCDTDDTFAFRWKDEVLWDLNDTAIIPDGHLSSATDINNLEQIVGEYEIGGGLSSYLYSGGRIEDLGFEGAKAINDLGQIVGSHFLYNYHRSPHHDGSLIEYGGELYDLNTLIKVAFGYRCNIPGRFDSCSRTKIKFTDLEVRDINNSGQIVGSAIIDGAEHAVLLNPINRKTVP